ncbi:stage II sporulation protein GA (sporulation sigma-E factor processing peptidase) [Desulfotomaculum arcticum]|uniref:Sporulation sigma-E factor-processing peptidase n=1 Tax=Desulfotruncus arcticus DSM 17038 TaxID=1121424 RepID=A0A1I2QTJ8_9FIRM|nr:sigma-E processing peptidase SpoIIGA [Desulfotruncus arcticus]SFG28951.1 stage II sporulation protein GA (sporulation sigma-E factor processing peptidase) [Desulfotomaculum arcticum] [Desulfotruncus arcticus DSM 17038]
MPSYVVYVDQVIAGSLVMNLMILWLTARLGRIAFRRWRLFAGAALGAVYSIVIFVPALQVFTGPGYKLLVSILMVAAAFIPQQPKKSLMLIAYFYLCTFALGGTVLGIINFLHRSVPGETLAGIMQAIDTYLWYGILMALAIFWFTGKIAPAALRKRLVLPLLRADLDINLRGKKVCLAAMVDTGNGLTDPLSGNPVIIAEFDAVKDILPEQVSSAVQKQGWQDGGTLLAEMGEGIREGNFRLIPFCSVGRDNGWLIGFRPDEVLVRQGGGAIRTNEVIIALCPDRLQGDTPCRALLPPDLFETRLAG